MLLHLIYQIFKSTKLSSDGCDIAHISLFFHKLPSPSPIPTSFHSLINAILSIFLEICRFFQCWRTAHSSPGHSSPKLLCNCSTSQKLFGLTIMSSSTFISLRGAPGLPLTVLIVPAALNSQNSYICSDPSLPHEGTPGELKAHAQKHMDAV